MTAVEKRCRIMETPLYPTFEKRIDDAIDRLLRKQVDPWAFFNAGVAIKLTLFDGKSISFPTGLEFSGSCRDQFWSRRNIDPFLEELVVQEIAAAVAAARERGVDAKLLLLEVEGLLLSSCKKVFNRMADIDRRLRGKGYPLSVQPRSIEDKYNRIRKFIERRIRAEIEMWRPKMWHEGWYESNKFWVWLIGTMLALAGLLVKFL